MLCILQGSAKRHAPGCVNAAGETEVVSNSSNKSHQTEGLPFSRVLYDATLKIYDQGTDSHDTLQRQEEPPQSARPSGCNCRWGHRALDG